VALSAASLGSNANSPFSDNNTSPIEVLFRDKCAGGSGIILRKPLAKYRRAKSAYFHPPPTRVVDISVGYTYFHHRYSLIETATHGQMDDTYINLEKNTHESSVIQLLTTTDSPIISDFVLSYYHFIKCQMRFIEYKFISLYYDVDNPCY